jgi:hypothetical protein
MKTATQNSTPKPDTASAATAHRPPLTDFGGGLLRGRAGAGAGAGGGADGVALLSRAFLSASLMRLMLT